MEKKNRVFLIIMLLLVMGLIVECRFVTQDIPEMLMQVTVDQNKSQVTPIDVDQLIQQAYDLFYTNYNEEGMEVVTQILEQDADNVDALSLHAAFYLREENGEDAKSDIDRAFELDPNHAFSYAVRSWYLDLIKEDYESAFDDVNHAIELDANISLAYAQRGGLSPFFEEEIDSLGDYQRCVELEPMYVAGHANLGIEYMLIENYIKAYEHINKAIEINKNVDYLYFYRGMVSVYSEEYQDALDDFDHAIGMGIDDPDVYFFRGLANLYGDDAEASLVDFNKAIDLGVEDDYVFFYRGAAYSTLHEFEAAAEDFEKVLEINPEDGDALNGAALMISLSDGDLDKALEYAEKSVELSPDEQIYLFTVGFVYYKMEEFDQAMDIFNSLIEEGYAYSYFGRSLIYKQQGQVEKAIEDLQDFLEEYPDDFLSYYARELLEELTGEPVSNIPLRILLASC